MQMQRLVLFILLYGEHYILAGMCGKEGGSGRARCRRLAREL